MGKMKRDKQLYSRMRASGVRKKVARQLAELPARVSGGKPAPKPLREAIERLAATASELNEHAKRGDRGASARKAARTRRANAQSRSASGRKAARSRSKG